MISNLCCKHAGLYLYNIVSGQNANWIKYILKTSPNPSPYDQNPLYIGSTVANAFETSREKMDKNVLFLIGGRIVPHWVAKKMVESLASVWNTIRHYTKMDAYNRYARYWHVLMEVVILRISHYKEYCSVFEFWSSEVMSKCFFSLSGTNTYVCMCVCARARVCPCVCWCVC